MNNSQADNIARKQLLRFLRVPTEGGRLFAASSKGLFYIDEFPEGSGKAEDIQFTTRPIFDIDGHLIFRDKILEIDEERQIVIRTAVGPQLGTPVWSVKAGPKRDFRAMANATASQLETQEPKVSPVLVDGEDELRLICYSYPRLGILCETGADPRRCVVDIADGSVLYLNDPRPTESPEFVDTIWSPLDFATRASVPQMNEVYGGKLADLDSISAEGPLEDAVEGAQAPDRIELSLNPELKLRGQQTKVYCAVATAQMILEHLLRKELTQKEIALAMKTGQQGTTNSNQIRGYGKLTGGESEAIKDFTASFDEARGEIAANRPLKSGVPGHARAVAGVRIEGDTKWLYVYDPWPAGEGDIYYEDWNAIRHTNYIYVRPASFE